MAAVEAALSDRSTLDGLKSRVDLVDLLAAHGVQSQRQGRSYKACCPFHEERTASFSVDRKKGVYHCFGCGKEGDQLTFLQDFKELSFAEAVRELRQLAGDPVEVAATPAPQAKQPFPFDLVARVAEVWHQSFCQRSEGLAYLEKRGLKDKEMLRLFKVGYCDGGQLLATSTREERESLRQVGVINERGKEFFSHCVVFPLKDREGRVVSFYGRAVLPNSKIPHRFCAGAKTGLFHPEAARGSQQVYLVEGVLDALAVYQSAIPNVMALGGTQGLNQALLDHLMQEKVGEVVLCLDGDGAGHAAAPELSARLQAAGLATSTVVLPEGQDPLSFLPGLSQAEAQGRLGCLPFESIAVQEPASVGHAEVGRSYRKLSASQGKLKVLVTVAANGERAQATVDLYSSRSRRQEAVNLARGVGLEAEELEQWFFRVLDELEARKDSERGENQQELFRNVEVEPMTPQQREEALSFLRRPDLIAAILQDLEALGYVGEEEAKLLGYCVSVSRKLDKPMSAIIQSGSGAGKSYLAEIIQALTPPEQVVFYSRLSPQALYHMPKDFLVHKMLMLEERSGGESSDYQIRSLQTSKKLVQAIVVKDPVTGGLFTRENEVHGPIAYLETTTNLRLNPENTSRCFEIPLDESPEQTRRIHLRQKTLKGLDGLGGRQAQDLIPPRHHRMQRLLEPVAVIIPYVDLLTFPDRWLRTRRDHDRFLCLIEVLAYLQQYQRPRKNYQGLDYIEATAEDYRWAYFLARRVLQNSLDELSRWARELITQFERQAGLRVTRRELRDQLQWPDRRTREALDELVDMEYLEVFRGPSNLFVYKLSALKDEVCAQVLGLLTPEELSCRWAA